MGAGLKRARAAARATHRKPDIVDILRANTRQLRSGTAIIVGPESKTVLADVMAAAADEISRLRVKCGEL